MKVISRKDPKLIGNLIVDGAYKYVSKFAIEDDEGNRIAEYDSIETLYRDFKDYKEQPKEYWYMSDNGYICSSMDEGDSWDGFRKEIGNYFKTKKEAEKYGEYLEALQTIKNDAKGFVPDWKDGNQAKRYGYYDHDDGCLEWGNVFICQNQGTVYFKSEEDIKESFEKHRKGWMIVLGVEE